MKNKMFPSFRSDYWLPCPGFSPKYDEKCVLEGGHKGGCLSPPVNYYKYNPLRPKVRGLPEDDET